MYVPKQNIHKRSFSPGFLIKKNSAAREHNNAEQNKCTTIVFSHHHSNQLPSLAPKTRATLAFKLSDKLHLISYYQQRYIIQSIKKMIFTSKCTKFIGRTILASSNATRRTTTSNIKSSFLSTSMRRTICSQSTTLSTTSSCQKSITTYDSRTITRRPMQNNMLYTGNNNTVTAFLKTRDVEDQQKKCYLSTKEAAAGLPPPPTDDDNNADEQLQLAAETVRRIKADLVEADINHDGRLQPEELKIILKKHSDVFSDEDAVKLQELFYIGKAGGSISHEDFIKGISYVMADTSSSGENDDHDVGLTHRRTTKRVHPLGLGNCATEFMHGSSRVYKPEELDIKPTHVEPITTIDKIAYAGVKVVRFGFDTVSLWNFGEITHAKVYRRVIFLETVAAIPGFVAAMVRHFKSLRNFSRDGGMLQMFLDEANNERMHLLTFVRMKNPSRLTRGLVLVSQSVVGAAFFILYNISPSLCHRFVGYVEEQAVHTYTDIINSIESAPEGSEMAEWRTQVAPAIARGYWHLGEHGTVLDMMYVIRADEAEHRDVNHVCSGIQEGQINPLYNPQDEFDKMLVTYVKDIMKKEKD